MNKKLNEDAMASELAGSAFFSQPATEPVSQPVVHDTTENAVQDSTLSVLMPRDRDTMTPRDHVTDEVLEIIRKAVKQLGKEDATYRFTAEEKKGLTDIVYTYGSAGVRTSQNEITRIGINYLLEDYRASGEHSILARVLERLNA